MTTRPQQQQQQSLFAIKNINVHITIGGLPERTTASCWPPWLVHGAYCWLVDGVWLHAAPVVTTWIVIRACAVTTRTGMDVCIILYRRPWDRCPMGGCGTDRDCSLVWSLVEEGGEGGTAAGVVLNLK